MMEDMSFWDLLGEEITFSEAEDMFREWLDDMYGLVNIAGEKYYTSHALESVNESSFEVGFWAWAERKHKDYMLFYTEDELKEYLDSKSEENENQQKGGKAMKDGIILDTTTAGGVRIVVRELRVKNGIAGQRAVTVDVDCYGHDWEEHMTPCFVHSIYGGPVVVCIGEAQVLVYDAVRYGDTSKLDETWIRNYFGDEKEYLDSESDGE